MSKISLEHNPNLSTIFMVEEVLNNLDIPITIAELKKKLPKKVNHNTLKMILEYLEKEGKISVSINGIAKANNEKLLHEIRRLFKMETVTEIVSGEVLLSKLSPETRDFVENFPVEKAKELYKKVREEEWKRIKYLTQAHLSKESEA